jgi:hypothetical protein
MWHMQLKDALERYTGLGQDALHVHASIILYLAAMLVLRRNWRSPVPWLIIFGLEAVNELLDLQEQYGAGTTATWQAAFGGGWPEGLKDVVNTMAWPTVLLVVGRHTSLFGPREQPDLPSTCPSIE